MNSHRAVLAGILVKVGTDIIDWNYLKRLRTAPNAGVAIMAVVLSLTVFVDLIIAFAIGMLMASMIFMKRMSDLQSEGALLVNLPTEETPLNDHEKAILTEAQGRILLYHMEGPLSFDVPAVDFTSSMALNDMISDMLTTPNRYVFLVGLRPKVKNFLEKQGTLDHIDKSHIYEERHTALCHAARVIDINPEACIPEERLKPY